jgi:hypothetical protein
MKYYRTAYRPVAGFPSTAYATGAPSISPEEVGQCTSPSVIDSLISSAVASSLATQYVEISKLLLILLLLLLLLLLLASIGCG